MSDPPGHRVVVTAGHVDHGKSTLVQALTGRDPDRLAEERRRGLTIDLGHVWTRLAGTDAAPGDVEVAFVDVPGHQRFITTMLAGAGPAPAALLIVAADDGWSAQSQEHRDVLALLRVPILATAITKAGLVSPERIEAVTAQVEAAVGGAPGTGPPVVVVDTVAGRGLEAVRTTLRDRLGRVPVPVASGRPRLWIDRAFPIAGAGTVVTGTLGGGRLTVGDTVELLPERRPLRIRALQSLERSVASAGPGERVAVNLGGIGHREVGRGDALVAGGSWATTTEVDVWIHTLPGATVSARGAWSLHVGSATTPCRVLPTTGPIEGSAPEASAAGGDGAGGHGSGGDGAARLVLDAPLPLLSGDRMVLREAGRRATIAGAVVADPHPGRPPRGRDARRRHARVIAAVAAAPTPSARVHALVEAHGGARQRAEVARIVGAPVTAVDITGLEVIGDHLVAPELTAAWEGAVAELGAGGHDRAEIERLVASLGSVGPEGRRDGSAAVAAGAVDHLESRGVLVRDANRYHLAANADREVTERRDRADAVVATLAAAPYAPPDVAEVAADLGVDGREVAALVQAGAIVRCGKVTFAASAVDQAVVELTALEADGGPFTASEARERLGTTRRFAIPLLEHLKRTGVTAFDGNRHRILPR